MGDDDFGVMPDVFDSTVFTGFGAELHDVCSCLVLILIAYWA